MSDTSRLLRQHIATVEADLATARAERQAAEALAKAVEAWRDAAPYDNGNHQEVYFDAMMDALAAYRAASETNEQEG